DLQKRIFRVSKIEFSTQKYIFLSDRAVHLFPHRFAGVVGQHEFPVEKVDISGDGRLVSSCSHDQIVRFWNTNYFEDLEVDGRKKSVKKKDMKKSLPSSRKQDAREFFSGLT